MRKNPADRPRTQSGHDRPERLDHALARRNGARGPRDAAPGIFACRCSSAARPPARRTPRSRSRPITTNRWSTCVDASRAVGVAGSLINPAIKAGLRATEPRGAGETPPATRRRSASNCFPSKKPRRRGPKFDWKADGHRAAGIHRRARAQLAAGSFRWRNWLPCIDWSPFFHTWELRGRYPAILRARKTRRAGPRTVRRRAKTAANGSSTKKLLTARGVYGFFPANSAGDDVELYADASRRRVLATFHFLRQQMEKPDGQPNLCLADFIARQAAAGITSALSPSPPASAWTNWSSNSRPTTTITTPS